GEWSRRTTRSLSSPGLLVLALEQRCQGPSRVKGSWPVLSVTALQGSHPNRNPREPAGNMQPVLRTHRCAESFSPAARLPRATPRSARQACVWVSIANRGPKLLWGPPGGPLPLPAKGRPFAPAGALFSISPEILKPIRCERRVANRRSNRLVAKIVLDRSGVPPIIGQLVAARVAQHMAADLEREARRLASARNHALVTCHAQGRYALGGEHVAPRLPLALQAAQGAESRAHRSGGRWAARPWSGAHAACQSGNRHRPSARRQARWRAARGGRRAGSRLRRDDPNGCRWRRP